MKQINNQLNVSVYFMYALILAWGFHSLIMLKIIGGLFFLLAFASALCWMGIQQGGWERTKFILTVFGETLGFVVIVTAVCMQTWHALLWFIPLSLIIQLVVWQNRFGIAISFYFDPIVDEFRITPKQPDSP